jgi:hypothetical protein
MVKRLPLLLARGRAVPWLTVATVAAEVVREGKKRWDRLSKRDQQDLVRIVRKLPGGPSAITAHDRARLRTIVGKVATLD